MANTNNNFSEYVKFYLVSPGRKPLLVENMIGWKEYGLDGARNMDYHGTLNKVTKTLGFRNEAKRLLDEEYAINGILSKISLIRLRLKDVNNVLSWVQDDPVFADFKKRKIENNTFYLNFYSNSLMDLIESHESDEFEIERIETIDNLPIDELQDFRVEIKGRSIEAVGESFSDFKYSSPIFEKPTGAVIPPVTWSWATKVVSEGPTRHSEQSSIWYDKTTSIDFSAVNLFYDNSVADYGDHNVKITLKIEELYLLCASVIKMSIFKLAYNSSTAEYNFVEQHDLYSSSAIPGYDPYVNPNSATETDLSLSAEINVKYNEGLMIVFEKEDTGPFVMGVKNTEILISVVTFFEASPSIRFLFYYDVIERLMLVLTGNKNSFTSSWLGRKEKGYSEDGFGSLIGFVSGLWMRAFKKGSARYKSPKIALKDALESIANCFNLGFGVETINNTQKLVLEDLHYFYRDEVVGRFPKQIKNQKENTDEKLFYSGMEFGFQRSGGLDQQMGLDEPNGKSKVITPVKTSKNKFIKISKTRADEYKLESLRRKSQKTNPNDGLSGDEDNWFLDLKRSSEQDVEFEQIQWQDRLAVEPTGIHSPETFRSMLFTPRAIMFRLASNFKSGIYLYKEKYINFISSSANIDLSMQFIDESKPYKENENVLIGELDRPIFINEIITFTHEMSYEVEELIFGKTEVIISGEKRMVPNYYFKMEFESEEGEILKGYYLKHEFEDNPTFTFQLSNEKII
jgi:hypothetical protein